MAWSDAARKAAAEARRRKASALRGFSYSGAALSKHPNYSASDLKYFKQKGYNDKEIKAFWDRDLAAGKGPVRHVKPPNVVGRLSSFLRKKRI